MRATAVKADRNTQTITITWDDEHVSEYPFAGLRAVCPCVSCKGGHSHMGQPPDPRIVREGSEYKMELEKVVAVGSYALQFFWGDGHNTGIYTWEMLRQGCPCAVCLPAEDA